MNPSDVQAILDEHAKFEAFEKLPLLDQHIADLARSGITKEQAIKAGIRSVIAPKAISKILNWQKPARNLGPCMLFTFPDVVACETIGDYIGRLKPDKPRNDDGKPVKYESPVGKPNRAYFPRQLVKLMGGKKGQFVIGDPPTLFITEGEKKALKATLEGFCCIGLVGVAGWSKKRETDPTTKRKAGERKLIDDLEQIAWKGHTVYIVFDSDANRKPDIRREELALGKVLSDKGAVVKIVRLPDMPNGDKCGIDDYLVAHPADDLRKLIDAAEPFGAKEIAPISQKAISMPAATFSNFIQREVIDEKGKPKTECIGLNGQAIRRVLTEHTDDWPRRINGSLFVPDGDRGPLWLPKVNDLFGWLQSKFGNDNDNAVRWMDRGTGFITRSEFDAYLRQNATRYDAVNSAPHWPPFKGHYYLHPAMPGKAVGKLDALLKWFSPATSEDGYLIAAWLLTLLWGGPYGQRPAFLFTGVDDDESMGRGIGKTSVVRMTARLVGGTFDLRMTDKWDDTIRRLLSNTECSTQRVILLDNVKTMRFSSSDVEALITSETINGRKMFVGDGRRPNTFTVAMTLNGASLSKDLAQRCVIIKLKRPTYSGNWESDLAAYIDANRWEIIADILWHLKRPVEKLGTFSRWGSWERDILGRLPKPEVLQKLIQDRRDDVDDDSEEAHLIRDAVRKEINDRGHGNPDDAGVRIPAKVITKIMCDALGEKLNTTTAGTKLKVIAGAIPEMRKTKYHGCKVWVWEGKNHSGPTEEIKESAEEKRVSRGCY